MLPKRRPRAFLSLWQPKALRQEDIVRLPQLPRQVRQPRGLPVLAVLQMISTTKDASANALAAWSSIANVSRPATSVILSSASAKTVEIPMNSADQKANEQKLSDPFRVGARMRFPSGQLRNLGKVALAKRTGKHLFFRSRFSSQSSLSCKQICNWYLTLFIGALKSIATAMQLVPSVPTTSAHAMTAEMGAPSSPPQKKLPTRSRMGFLSPRPAKYKTLPPKRANPPLRVQTVGCTRSKTTLHEM